VRRLLEQQVFAFAVVIIIAMLLPLSNFPVKGQEPTEISILGLVNNPLNLTLSNLLSLPTVSETVRLECVFGLPNVTLSWTGIPLFHLLTLAQVRPEAREVVFLASDGFSSSLPIEDVLQPYMLLGLKANGTLLSTVSYVAENVQGGFRVIAPGKYGYKWVTYVKEIEVVDYDYKGTYETTFGYTQEQANIPNSVPPTIEPPLQTFDLTFGMRSFQIDAFTNTSISGFGFNYLQKQMDFNIVTPSGATGFINLIVPNSLLTGPYTVFVDGYLTSATEANATGLSFVYEPFPEGFHTMRIVGTEFFGSIPEILVDYTQAVLVGETVTFNASRSASNVPIVSFEWDFGDGTKGTGLVVSHSYSKEGVYGVFLNMTDSDGISVTKTLTVNVSVPQQYISQAMRTFLIVDLSLVILLFTVLVLRREPRPLRKVEAQRSGLAT
jgi:hypothetical protein